MSRIRSLVESTFTPGVVGGFGGFGGVFRLPSSPGQDADSRLLVASADGAGTKVKVAILSDCHDTIGQDLVNHCVNDILVQGATPLFFLDYLAFGKLVPAVVEAIVKGVATGCRANDCALLGGETAEMPGMYEPPDYDIAGFIVGVVDDGSLLGPDRIREGDALVGLASSGLHTNGYSLARRIVFDAMGLALHDDFPGENASVAEVLLRVHRTYLQAMRGILTSVHAMAHITGGGIRGNLNRVLPGNLAARILRRTWEVPNIFRVLQSRGGVAEAEMFDAFNMGVGMIVVCDEADVPSVIAAAGSSHVPAWRIGEVVAGNGSVLLV
jgi:phosphoribosylformylglycinamidine cyclo-ligase